MELYPHEIKSETPPETAPDHGLLQWTILLRVQVVMSGTAPQKSETGGHPEDRGVSQTAMDGNQHGQAQYVMSLSRA